MADGSQLIVAVGVRVLVYDALDGDLLHSLKGECCFPSVHGGPLSLL